MKEIISRRNKKPYIFMLVISVISMIASSKYLQVPMLHYIALAMLIVLFLLCAICIYLLIDPHGSIERIDDTVIIRRGIRKNVIDKKDIVDVFPTPHPNNPKETQKNVISIKILKNGKEEILICGDVTDVDSTIKKLSDFIKES